MSSCIVFCYLITVYTVLHYNTLVATKGLLSIPRNTELDMVTLPDVSLSCVSVIVSATDTHITLLTWAGFKQQQAEDYSGLDPLTSPSHHPSVSHDWSRFSRLLSKNKRISSHPSSSTPCPFLPFGFSNSFKWKMILSFSVFCTTDGPILLPPQWGGNELWEQIPLTQRSQ